MLNFKLFLEVDKQKDKEIPEWFYVGISLTKDFVSGPSKSAPSGTAVTLNNLEGITTNPDILGSHSSFYRGIILKMPGKETLKLNKLSKIDYKNPDYAVSKGFRALKRVKTGYSDTRKTVHQSYLRAAIRDSLYALNKYNSNYFNGEAISSPSGENLSVDLILNFLNKFNPSRKDFIWKNKKLTKKEEKDPLKSITSLNQIGKRILKIIKIYNIDFYNEMKKDKFVNFDYALKSGFNDLINSASTEQEWVTKKQPTRVEIDKSNFVIPVNQLHVPLGSFAYIVLNKAIDHRRDIDLFNYFNVNLEDAENGYEIIKSKLKESLKGLIVTFVPRDMEENLVATVKSNKVNSHALEIPEEIISIFKKYNELTVDNYYRLAKKNNISTFDASKYLRILNTKNNIEIKDGEIKVKSLNFGVDFKQEIKEIFNELLNDSYKLPVLSIGSIYDNLGELFNPKSKEKIDEVIKDLVKDNYLFFKDEKYYLYSDYDEEENSGNFKAFDDYLEYKNGVTSVDAIISYMNIGFTDVKNIMLTLIRKNKLILLDNKIIKPLNEINSRLRALIDLIKNKGPLESDDLISLANKKFPSFKCTRDDLKLLARTGKIKLANDILSYKDLNQSHADNDIKLSFSYKKIINLFKKHFFTDEEDVFSYLGQSLSSDERDRVYTIKYNHLSVDYLGPCERLVPKEMIGKWSVTDCYEYKKLKEFFDKNPLKTINPSYNGKEFGLPVGYKSINSLLTCIMNAQEWFIVRKKDEIFGSFYCLKKNEDKITPLIDEAIKYVANALKENIFEKYEFEKLVYRKYPEIVNINKFIEELIKREIIVETDFESDTVITKKGVNAYDKIKELNNTVIQMIAKNGFIKVKELTEKHDALSYSFHRKIIQNLLKENKIVIFGSTFSSQHYFLRDSNAYHTLEKRFLDIVKSNIVGPAKIVSIYKFYRLYLNKLDQSLPDCELNIHQSKEILDTLVKSGTIKEVSNPLFSGYYGKFYTFTNINYNWLEDEVVKSEVIEILNKNSKISCTFDFIYYELYNRDVNLSPYPFIYMDVHKFKELLDYYVKIGLLESIHDDNLSHTIYKLKNQS